MSIRLIIPPLHDLATVVAGQTPPDGDPAPARVRLTPRGLTGAVLVAGQPRIVAAETHVITPNGLVVTLADPSTATPSGWQWQVLIDPERGQRAVGVIDPEITPGTLDGVDRVYQLAEVLAVAEAEAGAPVLVVKGPAGNDGPPPTVAWEGDRLIVGGIAGPPLTGGGGAARGLIITDADVPSIPAGTATDNLAAYYNSSASPITVAGVELAPGSHAVWAWVSGAWVQLAGGASTPPVDTSDTTPPVWAATLTTGTPTDTSVVISASALATDNVAVTGYRWRLTGESTAVARPIAPSGLNFAIEGLTANTAYAAPIFWAVAGGNKSAELVAQAFTTDAAPKKWTRVFYDTFTAPDGTLLSAHTPEMGGAWTMGSLPETQVILGGAMQAVQPAGWSGSATPDVSAYKTFSNPTRDVRVRATIDMRSGRHLLALRPANRNNSLELDLRADTTVCNIWGGGGKVVETTGLTAHMGPGVHDVEFTVGGDIATLRVDGAKLREWTITWGTWGAYIGTLLVQWGAASWYVGGSPVIASNHTSSVEIEVWK